MRYEDQKVKLVFQSSESAAANLKIRLRYDNLTQTEFFTSLVDLYIKKDENLMIVIESIKQDLRKMGKTRLQRTKKDYESKTR